MPTPFEQDNHKSTVVHFDFVMNSVRELARNRCVREAEGKPSACSPLSVVSNHEGKHRLVLNLRRF